MQEIKNNSKETQILEKAILRYGVSAQLGMFYEELAELVLAVNRRKRGREDNVAEEIADVLIMIKQIMLIFGIKAKDVRKIRKQKIDRLEKRLNGG